MNARPARRWIGLSSKALALAFSLVLYAGAVSTARSQHVGPVRTWPTVQAPDGARLDSIAPDVVLNGVPGRVLRFVVKGTEASLLEFYRQQFGARRVENRVRAMQVIAAQQGEFFHTVQLKALGPDTVEGTVLTHPMRGGGRSAAARDTEQALPPDSAVLTTLQSNDGGRRTVTLLAASAASPRSIRDHLVRVLQQRGMQLVQEDVGALQGREALSLMLGGAGEEALITITDAGRYRAVLVNRTKASE